jgi:DnaD/phage-associated family protein
LTDAMQGFPGFPGGKVRNVPVPEPFFSDLLPKIDHLGELKVTLYTFWRLSRMEGRYRYLRREDFTEDKDFMRGLAASPRLAQEMLDDALERAEARGTFLHVLVEDAQNVRHLYFVNSPRGREAVDRLTRGLWQPEADAASVTLSQVRSSVFVLYEQNIGPLTPLIADALRDAMTDYPAAWIEKAIGIAVKRNVRKWSYIQRVLEGMRAEDHHEQNDPSRSQDSGSRYAGYRSYAVNEPEPESD